MIQRDTLLSRATFAILIILMGLFSLHTLGSIYQDIGRHITMGRIIWETGAVPQVNLFSYTAPDFPFVNHHWLGGLMLYFGDRFLGLQALIVVKALLVACAFGLSLAAAWRSRVIVPAIAIGMASLYTMVERTDVRPEILSFVFLGWFLFVLYRKSHSRLLWTLPVVQALWVNTHIYFFMGPVLVIAWWMGEIGRSGRSAFAGRRHWLFAGLVALATFMNPAGYHGAFYPLTMWSNYGYSIAENKNLFFLHAYGYPIMTSVAMGFVVALTAVSFVFNFRNLRKNIDSLFLFLVATGLAFVMTRNFPLIALTAMPITLRNMAESQWRFRSRSFVAIALIFLALMGVSIMTNQIYDQAGISGRKFGTYVPDAHERPIEFYRTAGIHGPIFNNFDIGSYLIWKLPEEPVFIDGRPEAYPASFIQGVYIRMQEDVAVWAEQSKEYGINAIFWSYYDMTPWSQVFVERISKDPEWVTVYHARGIMILVKNTPENASIIAKHRIAR